MGAVTLQDARADALLGKAAHLLAQQQLVLVQREIGAGAGGGRAGRCQGHALLSTQSAITIFWISLVPS